MKYTPGIEKKFECLSCGYPVPTKLSRCYSCNYLRKRIRANPHFLEDMIELHKDYAEEHKKHA